jgi:uncharacterized protein (DUF2267 family)
MKRRTIGMTLAAVAVGGAAVARAQSQHTLERVVNEVRRRARTLPGLWQGARYRIARRHPQADVGDDVLADRVRSSIGPLEKQLDLPRVHVIVRDAIAILHGDVGTEDERDAVEAGVLAIYGVRGVESYLHVGLAPGDTRPSRGKETPTPPSGARRRLEAAVLESMTPATGDPERVLRSVLGTFLERIPADERDQVLSHLPNDARRLAESPHRSGAPREIRSVEDLTIAVQAAEPGMTSAAAYELVRGVLGVLADLVPEELSDIRATLPSRLAAFWEEFERSADPALVPGS